MDESTAREGVEQDSLDQTETDTETEATETEEVEETAADPEAETDEGQSDEADGEDGDESEEETADLIEFNFGGNKVAVPRGSSVDDIASEVQKFADGVWSASTKRNQEIAEARKQVQASKEAADKLLSLSQESLDEYARGLALKREIAQLENVDMDALWQSDSDRARQITDTISRKRGEFHQVVQKVSAAEQKIAAARAEETEAQKKQGREIVEKAIPQFAESVPKVAAYLEKTFGIAKEVAEQWELHPIETQLAWKAMKYDEMLERAKKPKPAGVKKPAPEPVSAPKRRGTAATAKLDLVRDAHKFSSDEWVRQRNAELKAKKRA